MSILAYLETIVTTDKSVRRAQGKGKKDLRHSEFDYDHGLAELSMYKVSYDRIRMTWAGRSLPTGFQWT